MTSAPSASPGRILAIDDDPISLAIASVLLESEGWEVLQATGGDEALRLLGSCPPPECILADLRMPNLAGVELARRLRQTAPGALLLAMSATPPAHVEGYDGVLKKPLSSEALRLVLRSLAADARQDDGRSEPSGAAEVSLVNLEVFERLRRAMSAAGLEEVVRAFLSDATGRIESMRSSGSESVRRLAHTVKGGASMVGAAEAARIAADIETGIDHHGDRLRKLDELEACLRRTERMLIDRLKV
jgi:CheY-like chemotaxis protein/HPt (histidine-containing phosphotransfer) domain-containing protein